MTTVQGLTRDQVVEAVLFELLQAKDPPEKAYEIAERAADRLGLRGETEPFSERAARLRETDQLPAGVLERVFEQVTDMPGVDMMHAVDLYDLQAEQDYVYPGGKRKVRKRPRSGDGRLVPVERQARDITGVVLHQTAVPFGVSKRQVAAADGDRRLALARRGLDVACHAIAFRDGLVVRTHPLEVHVNHGNGLNSRSLGLEVDGRYPGLDDKPETVPREDLATTWGGDPTELTYRTIAAARVALRDLVVRGRELGMPIEYLWAHRQSSATRRSDPGQGLWESVALWAVATLDLKLQPDLVVGDGRAIPLAWGGGARY